MNARKTIIAILAALSVSVALADDFKTIDGKEYKNVTVSRVEPDGIIVKTKSGISKVYFTELPKDVQERFGYDPARAAQFSAAQQAAAPRFAAPIQAQRPKQEAQRPMQEAQRPMQVQEGIRTIREISNDQRRFLDQEILLKGTIDVAAYYNFGYREAQRTHYAFQISDSSGSDCYAYMARGENGEKLHQQLIQAGRPLGGVFAVMLLSRRYNRDTGSQLLVELLNWSGQ
jgi:hypothetical protein